jgi:hypothetical protein
MKEHVWTGRSNWSNRRLNDEFRCRSRENGLNWRTTGFTQLQLGIPYSIARVLGHPIDESLRDIPVAFRART